jgi:hypothetical protein
MNATALDSRSALIRWRRAALAVGVVAAIVCILGATFTPKAFFRAYLFTYVFFLGIPLGALALLMIHHLTGGVWGFLIRRIVEAEMRTMLLAAILFLPVCFGLRYIYPWAAPLADLAHAHETIRHKYLDPAFFYWRAAIYFVLWLGLAGSLSAWSRQADDADDVRTAWKSYKLSGFGLVLLGFSLHFAAVDWIMSVEPRFTSTIFGPLVFSGQILSAFSAAVLAFCLLSPRPEYEGLLSTKAFTDLGSLLFTLLVLWAYMAWFQFMLIWMADLPHGAMWYLARGSGGWGWLTLALIFFHFVAPFFLLLFRAVKQTPRLLGSVAALIFAMQLLFDYYQIVPSYEPATTDGAWIGSILPIGFAGLWIAAFLWALSRRPLLPRYDLNQQYAIHLRALDEEEVEREEALANG